MSRPLLEIAANSAVSALAAQAGGADRIELCENLGEGGTTPSHGTLAVTRDRLRIPLYVLIRPRGGDFRYDEIEFEVMRRDIDHCVRLGCDGVVIGALAADGSIDQTQCRELIVAAGTLGVTFHRAFDAVRDQVEALETIIDLGCERVLTSGASANALLGTDNIAARVQQAGDRIRIMAGAGVEAGSLGELASRSRAHEFHASARSPQASAMRHRNPELKGLAADWMQTDAEQVRRLVTALRDTQEM